MKDFTQDGADLIDQKYNRDVLSGFLAYFHKELCGNRILKVKFLF
jgi:hypothetical protein